MNEACVNLDDLKHLFVVFKASKDEMQSTIERSLAWMSTKQKIEYFGEFWWSNLQQAHLEHRVVYLELLHHLLLASFPQYLNFRTTMQTNLPRAIALISNFPATHVQVQKYLCIWEARDVFSLEVLRVLWQSTGEEEVKQANKPSRSIVGQQKSSSSALNNIVHVFEAMDRNQQAIEHLEQYLTSELRVHEFIELACCVQTKEAILKYVNTSEFACLSAFAATLQTTIQALVQVHESCQKWKTLEQELQHNLTQSLQTELLSILTDLEKTIPAIECLQTQLEAYEAHRTLYAREWQWHAAEYAKDQAQRQERTRLPTQVEFPGQTNPFAAISDAPEVDQHDDEQALEYEATLTCVKYHPELKELVVMKCTEEEKWRDAC